MILYCTPKTCHRNILQSSTKTSLSVTVSFIQSMLTISMLLSSCLGNLGWMRFMHPTMGKVSAFLSQKKCISILNLRKYLSIRTYIPTHCHLHLVTSPLMFVMIPWVTNSFAAAFHVHDDEIWIESFEYLTCIFPEVLHLHKLNAWNAWFEFYTPRQTVRNGTWGTQINFCNLKRSNIHVARPSTFNVD